jgi:hypothetical protein
MRYYRDYEFAHKYQKDLIWVSHDPPAFGQPLNVLPHEQTSKEANDKANKQMYDQANNQINKIKQNKQASKQAKTSK